MKPRHFLRQGCCVWMILALLDGINSAGAQTLTLPHTLRGHSNEIGALVFSPDGRTLATASEILETRSGANYNHILLRDARTGHIRLRLKPLDRLDSLVFSPDGATLVSGSETGIGGPNSSGRVQVWDARTGRLQWTLVNKIPVSSVVYSPDGRLRAAIVGEEDKRFAIEVYDAHTGEVLHTLRHKRSVYSFAFTPDSRLLVSGSGGSVEDKPTQGSLDLWTLLTGRLLHAYLLKTPVLSIAVSPNGVEVATGLGDDTVKTWTLHQR